MADSLYKLPPPTQLYDFHTPPTLVNTPPHAALQIWLYSWSRPRWYRAELLWLAGTRSEPCHRSLAAGSIRGKRSGPEGGREGGAKKKEGDERNTDGESWTTWLEESINSPQNVRERHRNTFSKLQHSPSAPGFEPESKPRQRTAFHNLL